MRSNKNVTAKKLFSQRYLIMMSLPFVAWMAIYCYTPLCGWILALYNYRPGKSWERQVFVGLDNFKEFLTDKRFYEVIRNTLVMGGGYIFLGTVMAITFALILNETRSKHYKKAIQTISYLPHFVSWTIVASICYTLLSTNGIVNQVCMALGITKEAIPFISSKNAFWPIIIFFHVWKEMGWSAIIYLSAMTSIDPTLYEAADVDGVGRFGKILYITLPGISGTVALLLILNIGGIFNATGFDSSYLLGNPMVITHSDNLAVYSYRYGMEMTRFSMSTALSIFNSVVSLVLLFIANFIISRPFDKKII